MPIHCGRTVSQPDGHQLLQSITNNYLTDVIFSQMSRDHSGEMIIYSIIFLTIYFLMLIWLQYLIRLTLLIFLFYCFSLFYTFLWVFFLFFLLLLIWSTLLGLLSSTTFLYGLFLSLSLSLSLFLSLSLSLSLRFFESSRGLDGFVDVIEEDVYHFYSSD